MAYSRTWPMPLKAKLTLHWKCDYDNAMCADAGLTELLIRAQRGDKSAWSEAAPLVYQELRRIASTHFRNSGAGHILQPTALLHEAWLKLIRHPQISFENRTHFFSYCARLMRQVMADEARRRKVRSQPLSLTEDCVDFEDLDEALSRLAQLSARQAQVVEMRYFGGLSVEEIATALECSPRTVKRDWLAARTWLFEQLKNT